jgi:hypothetical protein
MWRAQKVFSVAAHKLQGAHTVEVSVISDFVTDNVAWNLKSRVILGNGLPLRDVYPVVNKMQCLNYQTGFVQTLYISPTLNFVQQFSPICHLLKDINESSSFDRF